ELLPAVGVGSVCAGFCALQVLQVASLSNESLEVTSEELHKLPGAGAAGDDGAGTNGQGSPEGTDSPVLFLDSAGAGESLRSTLQSVISGVGELDVEKDSPKKEEQDSQARERPYPDCPFLLLDVRDRDAYEQCHIVGGEHLGTWAGPGCSPGHLGTRGLQPWAPGH
uniref:Rhodanese domain-containing protein n=1 Tax=Junco hyemalis TaxID=40217 RepID=A0A8C5JSV7_JUNHY